MSLLFERIERVHPWSCIIERQVVAGQKKLGNNKRVKRIPKWNKYLFSYFLSSAEYIERLAQSIETGQHSTFLLPERLSGQPRVMKEFLRA